MDHISKVGIFLQVVKDESFIGAARSLGMTGPAVSKQIQSLEERLGVKLLNRTTRHVSLTEEGTIYFERARMALEDLKEAEQHIQELKEYPTGKLKISAPMSFGIQFLTKPIAKFAKQYPDVDLEIDFSDRWVDLVEENYDLIVRIASLEDSGLIARKLAPCPLVLCVSDTFIKEHGLPNSVDDIRNYPAVTYNRHGKREQWSYKDKNNQIHTISFNNRFASNTAEMQIAACLEGLGVALLPIFSAQAHLQSGRLVELFPELGSYPEIGIYILYQKNRYLSTRSRLFVDHLVIESEQFTWR